MLIVDMKIQLEKNNKIFVFLGSEKKELHPIWLRERVSEIDNLDEIYKLEIEYDDLVKQLQEQKTLDNSIKMSNYTSRLPKKVSKLKEKIAEMKNTLATSRRMVQSATPI